MGIVGRGDVEFGFPDAVTEQDQGERGVVLPGHPLDAVEVLAVGVQAARPPGGVRVAARVGVDDFGAGGAEPAQSVSGAVGQS